MTHTDQMRQMIALLESAPTTEGAINNTDYQMEQFAKILLKWQDKVEDLAAAADPRSGNWVKFLERNGQDTGMLRRISEAARALASDLLDQQMQIQPFKEDL